MTDFVSVIEENAGRDVKKLLVGCKCDSENERVVEYRTAKVNKPGSS